MTLCARRAPCCKDDGLPIERVSGGGTPCMWEAHTHPELTEHRAGIYVYGDRLTLRSGAVTLDTCAFKVHHHRRQPTHL